MTEDFEQPRMSNGNLTHDQSIELAAQTSRQVSELYHKARNLREGLHHGNTEMDRLNFGEGNEQSKLIYEINSERGTDIYSVMPIGEAFELKKTLKTGEGEKSIVIKRLDGQDFMRGELQRLAPFGRGVEHVTQLPDDAMMATVELVIGTLTAKVAERENNTSEAVAADIADVLGIEYPRPKPESQAAPEA